MMKQATMEMWYGFRQRMKTYEGWIYLVLIIFAMYVYYGVMKDNMVPIFFIPYMMGLVLGGMSGANTGKLSRILPMSPKEYKWLLYMKSCWVILVDIICVVIYISTNRIPTENYFEIIFVIMIPALMCSALLFIRSSLPIKLGVYEKGYIFPMCSAILGSVSVCFYVMWGVLSNILVKGTLCLLSYIFFVYAIWKVDRRLFNQRIYYDEVEKEAGKVHW